MALFTSVLTAGGNRYQTTSEHLNNLAKDLLSGSGVMGAFVNNTGTGSTGGFGCDAQSTPDNTVSIRAGVAYILATPTSQRAQLLRVEAISNQTVTIATNSSGSVKYDWIYIKVDTTAAANPAIDSSDVATLYTSRSTSSSVDNGTPPSTGLLIAVVTVANGFVTIANASIAGKRVAAALPTASLADGAVTTIKVADDAITSDKLVLEQVEANLASPYNITATAVWQDTGLSISLPKAGTYLLYMNVRGDCSLSAGTGGFISAKLYNSTDAIDVPNSNTISIFTGNATGGASTGTKILSFVANGPKTIKLYGFRGTAGTYSSSTISADVNGGTNIGYIRIT